LPLGGAMLVHSLYWRIDIILLWVLASSAEAALYGLSYGIVDALVALPGYVTVNVLPELAGMDEQRARFAELVQKEDFTNASPVLQILVVGVALTYLGSMLAQALVGLNRQSSSG
jgi:O-antigen/teichoic acid export membrane protein